MDGKLIKLPTDELLRKFGAGNHKPGSGSAAAFEGMLSAQLLRTVIDLTCDDKHSQNYVEWLPELKRIDFEIETHIYPALELLFQEDSNQFDKTVKQREARNKETDVRLKGQLAAKALQELKPATEIPIEIAKLCVQLGEFSSFVFDHGFKSARGDAGVAQNCAIAAVVGCLSIIDLNLLSFDNVEWMDQIRYETTRLLSSHKRLSLEATVRVETLKNEADRTYSYNSEINKLLSLIPDESNLTNQVIEDVARGLQNLLWKYRDVIWKHEIPKNPMEVLKPEVALKKTLGYQFQRSISLGNHLNNGELFEIAGLIDKEQKVVEISKQFPLTTQNFTVAHELGHAFFHKQTVLHRDKAIDGSASHKHRDSTELQADKFAAYFLMPRMQVKTVFKNLFLTEKFVINENTAFSLTGGRTSRVSDFKNECKDLRGLSRLIASAKHMDSNVNSLTSLAEIFQVSVETMAIRLEEIELIEF